MERGCRKSGSPFFMDVAEFCPAVATVLEGFSTIGTGASAISTGISLFGCNLVLRKSPPIGCLGKLILVGF